MSSPKVGDKAPDFELAATGDQILKSSSFEGKKIVLYFYPKDSTSGCTIQAKDFSALKEEFAALNTLVIGISPDNIKSHERFVLKQELSIDLISDPDHLALQAYGVWQEKMMYGKKYMGVVRSTFIIDENGKIANIWTKVRAKEHAATVLETIQNT